MTMVLHPLSRSAQQPEEGENSAPSVQALGFLMIGLGLIGTVSLLIWRAGPLTGF